MIIPSSSNSMGTGSFTSIPSEKVQKTKEEQDEKIKKLEHDLVAVARASGGGGGGWGRVQSCRGAASR